MDKSSGSKASPYMCLSILEFNRGGREGFALPSFVGMFRIRAPNAEASHPSLCGRLHYNDFILV
jgi:hypothetical protein